MTTILSPNELPHGWHRMYTVKDAAEAEKIANGCTAYLYQSSIIQALYLFIPVG
jgi:hypothetical protein